MAPQISNNLSKRAKRNAKKKEIKVKEQEEAAQALLNTQDSATDTPEYQQQDDEMIDQGQSNLNFIEHEDKLRPYIPRPENIPFTVLLPSSCPEFKTQPATIPFLKFEDIEQGKSITIMISFGNHSAVFFGTPEELIEKRNQAQWWLSTFFQIPQNHHACLHQMYIDDDGICHETDYLPLDDKNRIIFDNLESIVSYDFRKFENDHLVDNQHQDIKPYSFFAQTLTKKLSQEFEYAGFPEVAELTDEFGAAMGAVVLAYEPYAINLVHINHTHPAFPCKQCESIEHDDTYCTYYEDDSSFTCFNCASPMHTIADCPLPLTLRCTVCLEEGHIRSNCTHVIPPYEHAKLVPLAQPRTLTLWHQPEMANPNMASLGVMTTEHSSKTDMTDFQKLMEIRLDENGQYKPFHVSGTTAVAVTTWRASQQRVNTWVSPMTSHQYDQQYLQHLGRVPTFGYRTQVDIDNSYYGYGSLRILHQFCGTNSDRPVTFCETHISPSAIVGSTGVTRIHDSQLPAYFAQREYSIAKCEYHAYRYHLRVTTARDGFHHVIRGETGDALSKRFGREFEQTLEFVKQSFCTGDTDILQLELVAPSIVNEMFLAWNSFTAKLAEHRTGFNPFNDMWEFCSSPGLFRQFSDINEKIDIKHQENDRVWMTVRERSTVFAYGLHRELKLAEGISALTERKKFSAIAIPEPYRLAEFDTSWLVIIPNNRDLAIMPRPGDKVKIAFHDISYKGPQISDKLTASEEAEIITKYLIAAELRASDVKQFLDKQSIMAQAVDDITKPAKDKEANAKRASFIRISAANLLRQKIDGKLEKRPDHRIRIHDWVDDRQSSRLIRVPPNQEPELPLCRGTCISLKDKWKAVGSIAFQVFAPTDPRWRKSMGPAPLLELCLPKLNVRERVDSEVYLRQLAIEAARTKLKISIYQQTPEETAQAELQAVYDLSNIDDDESEFTSMSQWLADFHEKHETTLDITCFPALHHTHQRLHGTPYEQCLWQSGLDKETVSTLPVDASEQHQEEADDEVDLLKAATLQQQAKKQEQDDTDVPQEARSLISREESDRWLELISQMDHHQQDAIFNNNDKLPHGFKLIIGCPGSGKTTTIARFLALCLQSVVNPNDFKFIPTKRRQDFLSNEPEEQSVQSDNESDANIDSNFQRPDMNMRRAKLQATDLHVPQQKGLEVPITTWLASAEKEQAERLHASSRQDSAEPQGQDDPAPTADDWGADSIPVADDPSPATDDWGVDPTPTADDWGADSIPVADDPTPATDDWGVDSTPTADNWGADSIPVADDPTPATDDWGVDPTPNADDWGAGSIPIVDNGGVNSTPTTHDWGSNGDGWGHDTAEADDNQHNSIEEEDQRSIHSYDHIHTQDDSHSDNNTHHSDKSDNDEVGADAFDSAIEKEIRPLHDGDKFPRTTLLVVAQNNEQLNDVASTIHRELRKFYPHKQLSVIRASPITTVANILASDTTDYDEQVIEMLDPEKLVMEATEPVRQARAEKPMAFKSSHSVAEMITHMMDSADQTPLITNIKTDLAIRTANPQYWRSEGRKRYQKHISKLIKHIYRNATVVVCTGHAASTLGSLIKPTILWIDEAFRITEPNSLIPLAKWKDIKLKVFSGDAKQLPPLILTQNTHLSKNEELYYVNPFAPQLAKPLALRMFQSAAVRPHSLMINYRAIGGVSNFASEAFYGGEMFEGREITDHDQERIYKARDLLRTIVTEHTEGSSICIDIEGKTEVAVGTSFANPTHVQCIMDIIRSIFRSDIEGQETNKRAKIIVTAPYEAQTTAMERALEDLHPMEWVPGLVEVRTGAGVQGSEADICIVDLVRSGAEGFLGDKRLGSPLSTRASLTNIFIYNSNAWRRSGVHINSRKIEWLTRLEKYHIPRGAIVKIDEKKAKSLWLTKFCHSCKTRHDKIQCPNPICLNCERKHPTAQCPSTTKTLSSELSEIKRPIDSLFSERKADPRTLEFAPSYNRTFVEMRGLEDQRHIPRPRNSKFELQAERTTAFRQQYAEINSKRRQEIGQAKKQAEEDGTEFQEPEEVASDFDFIEEQSIYDEPTQDASPQSEQHSSTHPVATIPDEQHYAMSYLKFTLSGPQDNNSMILLLEEIATRVITYSANPNEQYIYNLVDEWDLILPNQDTIFIHNDKTAVEYSIYTASVYWYHTANLHIDIIIFMIKEKLKDMRHARDTANIPCIDTGKILAGIPDNRNLLAIEDEAFQINDDTRNAIQTFTREAEERDEEIQERDYQETNDNW